MITPLQATAFTVFAALVSCVDSRAVEFRLPDATLSEETQREKFLRSDANNDQKLTFDEFLHMEFPYVLMKKTEFDRYDTNGDGVVSSDEFKGQLALHTDKYDRHRARYFGRIYGDYDEDFDMKLSEEEVKKMIEHRFQLKPGANFAGIFRSFDSNKDGGLDIDEYIKFDEDMPLEEFVPGEESKGGSGVPSKKTKSHSSSDTKSSCES
uniref:EF-hand domain-containing protein n=1 Tax=Parascaris univalens TaxID=6257 RepID=A0A915BVW7_PARUN